LGISSWDYVILATFPLSLRQSKAGFALEPTELV
jgi:hypothetical protein